MGFLLLTLQGIGVSRRTSGCQPLCRAMMRLLEHTAWMCSLWHFRIRSAHGVCSLNYPYHANHHRPT
eukprot:2933658-Amphidinium_carterae.1